MISRDFFGGPITVFCDSPDCHEGIETGRRNFDEARAAIKEDGWRIVRFQEDWQHICRDCEVPRW